MAESRGASLPPVPVPAGGRAAAARSSRTGRGPRENIRLAGKSKRLADESRRFAGICDPVRPRLAPGGQQRSWDFLGCLTGLLNSKEMLHMFKKCVSIWDARGLAQKSSEPALKRKGPQAQFTDIFGRQASL